MTYVSLNELDEVVAVYARPQNEPTPSGYAEIADDDARLAAFYEALDA